MTITRLWQAGLESNGSGSLSEFTVAGGVLPTISSAYAKTGTYSLKCMGSSTTSYADVIVPATRQIEFAFHLNGARPISSINVFSLRTSSAPLLSVYIIGGTPNLVLKVGSTDQATANGTLPVGSFAHFGVSIKIHSSTGWVKVYKDGAEILSYTGNTGNADIACVRFGTDIDSSSIVSEYYDDLYIDDTTGEAAAAVVPDRRFAYITPNGNGNYSQCTGSDTNKTDNYLLVDEQPHNSDTDYVAALAADERDTYAMSTFTIPANFGMTALIPHAYARKTDAAVATLIANTIRCGTTDADGANQSLPSSYGLPLWTRYTKQADGVTSWDQTSLDGVEVGHVGRGAF